MTFSGNMVSVDSVEIDDEYIHVRFRDPDDFDDIRTPDWAEDPAHFVSEGSEVRMGQAEKSDDWKEESVLTRRPSAKTMRRPGKGIVEKTESE